MDTFHSFFVVQQEECLEHGSLCQLISGFYQILL